MRSLFLFLSITLILCSCHPFSGTGPTSPCQLTDNSFYNIDSVRAVAGAGNEQAARKKMLQAIDIYKNGKDPAKSIGLFKSSILLKPSGNAYFELGSALLDAGQTEEATLALHIAEKLDYSPLSNVMYKLSAAYAQLLGRKDGMGESAGENYMLAIHYMEVALQMGFSQPEQFRSNDLFATFRNSYRSSEFNGVYTAALSGGSGNKNPDKMLWETFAAGFQAAELPLVINAIWVRDHKLENPIGYDYEKFVPEMRNGKFSREVGSEYFYFAALKKDTAYTALLYAGKNDLSSDSNQQSPVYFYLVTYDAKGKIIDKMKVAGQENFSEPFKVLTILPNYSIEIREFRNIYKDDPKEKGYDSNVVIRSEPLGASSYRIAATGKFEKLDAPLAISFPPSRSGSAFPQ